VRNGLAAGFDQWLQAVFDHPAGGEPEWFWAQEFHEAWDSLGLTSADTVAYLTQLYRRPAVLRACSLEQVAQGIWGGTPPGEAEIHQACLRVMSETLYIPSELCRLSALHGVNHWSLHHRPQVVQTIDAFLEASTDLSTRVREYAAAARKGLAL
jgi:hypothetical protein